MLRDLLLIILELIEEEKEDEDENLTDMQKFLKRMEENNHL